MVHALPQRLNPANLELETLSEIDPHSPILHLHRKSRMHQRPTRLMLSSRHVKLKAMPRASNDTPIQKPLTQRPALMRTNSIQGVKLAVHVEQRDDPIAGYVFTTRAHRQISNRRQTLPIRHSHAPIPITESAACRCSRLICLNAQKPLHMLHRAKAWMICPRKSAAPSSTSPRMPSSKYTNMPNA